MPCLFSEGLILFKVVEKRWVPALARHSTAMRARARDRNQGFNVPRGDVGVVVMDVTGSESMFQ